MFIIDLDKDYSPPKRRQDVTPIESVPENPYPTPMPVEKKPALEEDDKKGRLLREIEEKETYIRYQRAMAHRNYRNLLGNDLLPKKGITDADFIEIYEQIDEYTKELTRLYIRKQQVEKYGDIRNLKVMTNEDLARIGALKNRRSRLNDNLYKARKAHQAAEATGNTTKATNATEKLSKLELEYLEVCNELERLKDA